MTKLSKIVDWMSTTEGLCTTAGALALAGGTNATIVHAGGYITTAAPMIAGMSFGIFAGARALGANPKGLGLLGAAIMITLVAGEAYNFEATAEVTVAERDAAATPLLAAKKRHTDALDRLHDLEAGMADSTRLQNAKEALAVARADIESERVKKARADLKAARDDVEAEAATGGCRKACERKQSVAKSAEAELTAALAAQASDRQAGIKRAEAEVKDAADGAENDRKAEIETAKADVAKNPLPPDATPLATHTGWAAWAIDLIAAGLRSMGCNGLAGALVAFGARRKEPDIAPDAALQSDFSMPDSAGPEIAGYFRPDNGAGPAGRGPDRPKRPGPSGGLTKSQALDDIMRRLADGRTIPSQDTLASDWNRPKQTVSDWMKEWRRIGVIPAPVQSGRCKATTAS